MRILYGTGNQAKFASMKELLASFGVELISLGEMSIPAPAIAENGQTPLENARIKASAYYRAFGLPVFSCDSGLYFDHIPEELQPGIHVRVIGGRRLNDEEMIGYYSKLAKKFGDLSARYQNAICFIKGAGQIYESMDDSLSGDKFIITGTPHRMRKTGFPLDSLSIHIKTGKYYFDMENPAVDQTAVDNGFRQFFSKYL